MLYKTLSAFTTQCSLVPIHSHHSQPLWLGNIIITIRKTSLSVLACIASLKYTEADSKLYWLPGTARTSLTKKTFNHIKRQIFKSHSNRESNRLTTVVLCSVTIGVIADAVTIDYYSWHFPHCHSPSGPPATSLNFWLSRFPLEYIKKML